MCRLIFLLFLMANIMPQYSTQPDKGAEKCYEAFRASDVVPNEIDCEWGVCFLMKCTSDSDVQGSIGCGKCGFGTAGLDFLGCKCEECKENLCNQPKYPIKKCYVGRSNNSGEYKEEMCDIFNNDGCKTVEHNGGRSAQDYEKSCGKCPAPDELPKGSKCTNCSDKDLCNIDKDKGSIKQCYMGNSKTGKFEKEDCKYYNNDGCHTFQCGDLFDNPEFYKSCGKCPALGDGAFSIKDQSMRDCNCIDCATGNLCNEDKDIGSTKQCYGGRPDSSGKFKMEDCKFYNNDGCRTFQCGDLSKNPEFYKYCGTNCPAHGDDTSLLPKEVRDGIDCKCSNCTGNLCNEDKNKGTIKQCFGGDEGNYKEQYCKFYNNDGCHTIECEGENEKDKKSCGKCPPPEKLDPGCKCEECIGEMCNKEVTVNQCYWGDDQKGYEAIDCKAPQNTACKKVKCRGDNHYTNPETGKPGFKHHRDCGKCSEGENDNDCRCFMCKDKDLCNGGMHIGFSSFMLMLSMIGGVVTLLGMKPLVGIGIC